MRPSRLEQKEKIKDFIRNNPDCTYLDIKNNTKIHVERHYKSMKEAYQDAGVSPSKNLTKRNKQAQREAVISYLKANSTARVPEIRKATQVNVYKVFGSILEAYRQAGLRYPTLNHSSGVRNPVVAKEAKEYEKKIFNLLGKHGTVSKISTLSWRTDCILDYDNRTFVVEIKNFRARNNITNSQIKQLVRYLKILNFENGLLVCPKESFPKRKNTRFMQIEDLKIHILSEEDLNQPSLKI